MAICADYIPGAKFSSIDIVRVTSSRYEKEGLLKGRTGTVMMCMKNDEGKHWYTVEFEDGDWCEGMKGFDSIPLRDFPESELELVQKHRQSAVSSDG